MVPYVLAKSLTLLKMRVENSSVIKLLSLVDPGSVELSKRWANHGREENRYSSRKVYLDTERGKGVSGWFL